VLLQVFFQLEGVDRLETRSGLYGMIGWRLHRVISLGISHNLPFCAIRKYKHFSKKIVVR